MSMNMDDYENKGGHNDTPPTSPRPEPPTGQSGDYDLTDDGKGKKYDSGKSMVGTTFRIFANSLLGIGACVEFGTHKYPKSDNWKLVDDGINRYTNSLLRHLAKHFSGQERDPETGLPHLFHAGWNMLAIIEFYLMEHPEIVKEIQK